MASALSDKLYRLVKEMRGQARITEANVQDMLREVRMALLEADVALPVVRDFIARVKDKAMGQEVMGSLSPGQALVAIVNRSVLALLMTPQAPLGLTLIQLILTVALYPVVAGVAQPATLQALTRKR